MSLPRGAADGLPLPRPSAERVAAGRAAAAAGGEAADAATRTGGTFGELGLAPALAAHIEGPKVGFARPTGVQRQAIPVLLSGRDALVNAATGSGKTLAYAAPIVHSLGAAEPRLSRADGAAALVIVPTRELAAQVLALLEALTKRYIWLVPGAVTGGESRDREKARLRKGITVLVATPGRLLDHLQKTQAFKTEALRWLVLDEADRLLDLGFERDLNAILELLGERLMRERWQSALLSATLTADVERLAKVSLRRPARVGFKGGAADGEADGGVESGAAATGAFAAVPRTLKQRYALLPCRARMAALALHLRAAALADSGSAKLVVFLSTCQTVDFHHMALSGLRGVSVGGSGGGVGGDAGDEGGAFIPLPLYRLHGSMPQAERAAQTRAFSQATSAALLCTDVAARGLDFPGLTEIVQFDAPGEASEYVHRIGRAARAGRSGVATLFLLPTEVQYVDVLRDAGAELSPSQFSATIEAAQLNGTAGRKFFPKAASQLPGPDPDVEALAFHPLVSAVSRALEQQVSRSASCAAAARDAFVSHIRAYAAHAKSLKAIFHVKKLHLGHVAKAFGLREPPAAVGRKGGSGGGGKGGKGGKGEKGGKRKGDKGSGGAQKKKRMRPHVAQE